MEPPRTIKEWRAIRLMSQKQLADAIGSSEFVIWQWESNRRGMAAHSLRKVAAALGVSMDDIELPDGKRYEPSS